MRRFADSATGEVKEYVDLDDDRRPAYNFPGGFTAISNRIGLQILSKESGLTPSDRDVLALHVHGPEKRGDVLRWPRAKMAEYVGISARTVATAIKRLTKAGLLIEAERHGRVIYYKVSPHHASRGGGDQQREDAAGYRLPVVPGLPERKGRTA
ncbi:helix-turn-helix domain-containing protein [Streptomyces sp. NPDC048565]|uniref:transcriptional regulator n=1 Tax=Streptomyces sp. NPDC048565 TaxID=3155266 RepID=UPI00342C893B